MENRKEIDVKLDALWLADIVAEGIFNQGKAKLFNILESQFEGQKLEANKRLVKDVLVAICKDSKRLIIDVLGDWVQDARVFPTEESLKRSEIVTSEYQEYDESVNR